MAITFRSKCSYQNEVEYEVFGHPFIRTIEAYSLCPSALLDYQREIFNGTDGFEDIMVARQGGALIRYVNRPYGDNDQYWADRRWTQEFYGAYVQWLKDEQERFIVEHEARRRRLGYASENYPRVVIVPIPRPLFYNLEAKRYDVEPWFRPEMATSDAAASRYAACGSSSL